MDIVHILSEKKTTADGVPRSWEDRKGDHLAVMKEAPIQARAIALADKLHNLESMQYDHDQGVELWGRFNATKERILWYHRTMVECCDHGEERLRSLARAVLVAVEKLVAAT
jgi:(p)ppGpp synthase/HD superfamily hydrolase